MAEILQQQRELEERVLERAEADPEWKRQYIEDPKGAVGDMPEAQRLIEMEESALPPEQQPPEAPMVTPSEEHRQQMRSLTEKVLERAASDPHWKRRLLDDPEAAVREADFPELKRLDEISDEIRQEEETRGHYLMSPDVEGVSRTCYYYSVHRCCKAYTCHQYSIVSG